jgi:hypothetical protein
MAPLPTPDRLDDVVLGPLAPAAGTSTIGCIADTGSYKLTHLRGDTAEGPVDRLQVHAPADREGARTSGNWIYAGPYLAHFGHFLAEFMHRLWAATLLAELAGARIAFQAQPGNSARWPHWLTEVLALCGIDRERVMLVERPTRFETLYVPAQGRILGGEVLLPDYASLFPLVPLPPLGLGSRLYVSRAGQLHNGSYLGEILIERALTEAGYHVLHPEGLPVAEVAARMRGAREIVFAEGSAIHHLELCGPIDARLFVIGRRDGTKRRFGRLLESLAPEVQFFGGARPAAYLDWNEAADLPRKDFACSVIDREALLSALQDFSGLPLGAPGEAAIEAAVRADLLRFLLDPRSGQYASDAAVGRALRSMRQEPALSAALNRRGQS